MHKLKAEASCKSEPSAEMYSTAPVKDPQQPNLKLTNGKKRSIAEDNFQSPPVFLRSSNRELKKRSLEVAEGIPPNKLNHRQCGKSGCDTIVPICFASTTERCAGSGYTSRWYHMSAGEHYCNECFEHFYRSYKDGYNHYVEWKTHWSANSRLEPSLKAFMADQLLPYWVQCTISTCKKWRQLNKDANLTPDFLAKFQCKFSGQKKDASACQVPEDSRVCAVISPWWIESLSLPALLINSPAAQFLHDYYCDGVGLSPTSVAPAKIEIKQSGTIFKNGSHGSFPHGSSKSGEVRKPVHCGRRSDCREFLQPFYQPLEQRKALCTRPDVMEVDEIGEFPQYRKDQHVMFLGIRNLIIALWNVNPKEWLTIEKVENHLICRGLVRIRCVSDAEKILSFLTKKGIVNFGFVQSPAAFSLLPECSEEIIVIGAGASGLGAARHLQNLGLKVTVLEASNRIGGRICDENAFGGICVGRGAQIVTGVINNPVTVFCRQAGFHMWVIGDKCDLYDDRGRLPPSESDQRVDFHFNAILDAVADWRKNQKEDSSLLGKLQEMHQAFLDETDVKFTQEEERLLDFHVGNLEYACGSSLANVSSLQWDQNEQFPQFVGHHSLLPSGYLQLMKLLAEGLDVRLNHQVTEVDYNEGELISVKTSDGKIFEGTKALVTVPLALLQQNAIHFSPALPARKVSAFNNLGAGIIEKVGLQFPCRFWERKLQDADMFGRIPSSSSERGLFSVFYDLTSLQKSKPKSTKSYVLMTYVSGDAVTLVHEKSDANVVEMCLDNLRKMFADEDTPIPEPTSWFVTRWKANPWARMAYSYVKLGGSGEDYDLMAESVDDKVYFAGEATNRQFPQTVSGAYLSGVREAYKILRTIEQM